MLFNSIDFAVFLPIVFILYWFAAKQSIKLQNLLIVIASYFFYGWWDWRFLLLILFSTIVDYSVGLGLENEKNQTRRKLLLWISILVNLGFLGFFKYYNFFLENFISMFSFMGRDISARSLNIILPVGISFYTFQTLSYTIDIYREKLKPTHDYIAFSAFVAFFPQLVAGPIERASNLLPQFYKKRYFDYSKSIHGLRQILWGLFKKIVIADNCAVYANRIFDNPELYSGSTLYLGVIFFAFQIYGDFSGYSDIAIGTSKLFGFNLMRNFAYPYFSRDIAEFWRRWHISLSSWFRDYLYIPIGGSKGGTFFKIRNIFIIFVVSGFWHGANWTFIIWGALNAIYFLPLILSDRNRQNMDIVARGRKLPTINDTLKIVLTFNLTLIAWIFFRSESVAFAFNYISGVFSGSFFSFPVFPGIKSAFSIIILVIVFLYIEWKGRDREYALAELITCGKKPIRYLFYSLIIFSILWFGGEEEQFIYFQF